MTHSREGDIDTIILEQIDGVCMAFERALKEGGSPGIAERLAGWENSARSRLLEELLVLELDYRRRRGESPSASEYHARFPHDGKVIDQGFERSKHDLPAAIGKYRVISRLSGGGQSIVYRVVHPALEKELVLKISRHPVYLNRADEDRLLAEGRMLAELDHPNVARVYDLDVHEGRPFLVLEYVRGTNLRQSAEGRQIAPREAAELTAKLARTLHAAHLQGIRHLDIKPENVVIDEHGQPRVIDFGLARLRNAWNSDSSIPSGVSGTAPFMPPEQARGDAVDQRTDVFALGALLYWLLSGEPPFAGQSVDHSLTRARDCDFHRNALDRPGISRRLRGVCLKAMAADPADRYPTAEALAERLERFVHRSDPRRRWVVAALVAFALIVAGSWIMRSFSGTRPGSDTRVSIDLDVTVGRRGVSHSLSSAVPLYTGDDVQIQWRLPSGYQGTLFWFDTEAELYELPSTQSGPARFVWPAAGAGQEIVGPAGTEVVFVCAQRGAAPTKKQVETLLGSANPWPDLPADCVLEFDEKRMAINRPGPYRAPGDQRRPRQEADVTQHATAFRQTLAREFDLFVGIAFAHADRAALPARFRRQYDTRRTVNASCAGTRLGR
jgi:serine/threonine protein kinase